MRHVQEKSEGSNKQHNLSHPPLPPLEAILTDFLPFFQSRPIVSLVILCDQDEGWGKRMNMVYE